MNAYNWLHKCSLNTWVKKYKMQLIMLYGNTYCGVRQLRIVWKPPETRHGGFSACFRKIDKITGNSSPLWAMCNQICDGITSNFVYLPKTCRKPAEWKEQINRYVFKTLLLLFHSKVFHFCQKHKHQFLIRISLYLLLIRKIT